MNRREVLFALGGGLTGAAGGYGFATGDLNREAIGELIAGEPPKTETKIGETQLDGELFRGIIFYESGGAEIYLSESHGLEEIGLTHSALSLPEDDFADWNAPTYSGPLLINLKAVLQNNGPYPSARFRVGPMETEYLLDQSVEFVAPDEFVAGQIDA
jgi:hypothetical protein